MSYKETKSGVEYLVLNELDMASKQFGPRFASMHEGYAVLLEEVEEAQDELVAIKVGMTELWNCTRNENKCGDILNKIEASAVRLACEAVQVAAMAKKAMR